MCNVFLHGVLNKEIYMRQPTGFTDPKYPNHVCRLNKALYGLKQVSRSCYRRLANFLILNLFHNSKTDSSLFTITDSNFTLIVLVYVDDLVITSSETRRLKVLSKLFANSFIAATWVYSDSFWEWRLHMNQMKS